MPRLLPASAFDRIFAPLQGRRVKLTEGQGFNPGDVILYRATEQLCDEFGVVWRGVTWDTSEHVLLFAGGNVLSPYANEIIDRYNAIREATKRGLPMTLLPQSFWQPYSGLFQYKQPPAVPCEFLYPIERLFVREMESLKLCAHRAILAPDLALGFHFPELKATPTPCQPRHIIRTDDEGKAYAILKSDAMWRGYRDPTPQKSWNNFCVLATSARHIYTDRLHIAITALAYGRRVTLIENNYHKNTAMWQTWLNEFGCEYMPAKDYAEEFKRK